MRGIAFIVYPGCSMMVMAAVAAFDVANEVVAIAAGNRPYDIHCISEIGGKIATSAGVVLESKAFTDMPFDTLILCGATTATPATPGLIAYLKEAPKRHRRVAALCTGAFMLAEAALLDGRRATTSWPHAEELQRLYPTVKLDPDRIFVNDGPIWTSASGMAGLDLRQWNGRS